MAKRAKRNLASFEQGDLATEWPEKMMLSLARKFLGISFSKMSTLVSSGVVKFERSPLDHRVKVVMRADLEKLKRQFSRVQQAKEMRTSKR
jgi:hypothetical protein